MEVLGHYELEQKIELTENMLSSILNVEQYHKTNDDSFWDLYAESEKNLLKRYGKALLPYTTKQFHFYFDCEIGLTIKKVYSQEEYNNLPSELQSLDSSEKEAFFRLAKNAIRNTLQSLYLEKEPDFEIAEKEGLSGSNIDKEATDARLCLTVYYLLKAGFNVEPRNNKYVSQIARFAHMLRGRSWPGAANSALYKKLRTVPEINTGENHIKDLKFIRTHFEDLDLKAALELIDKEIENAISKLPTVKQKVYRSK
jgi:hypothetical protein